MANTQGLDVAGVVAEYSKKAQDYVNDPDRFGRLVDDARAAVNDLPGSLDGFFKDVATICSMAKSFIAGEYRDIPTGSIVAVAAALLYIVMPNDLIPDRIPIVGLVDDVAVVAFVVSSVKIDVEKYRAWAAANGVQIL